MLPIASSADLDAFDESQKPRCLPDPRVDSSPAHLRLGDDFKFPCHIVAQRHDIYQQIDYYSRTSSPTFILNIPFGVRFLPKRDELTEETWLGQ